MKRSITDLGIGSLPGSSGAFCLDTSSSSSSYPYTGTVSLSTSIYLNEHCFDTLNQLGSEKINGFVIRAESLHALPMSASLGHADTVGDGRIQLSSIGPMRLSLTSAPPACEHVLLPLRATHGRKLTTPRIRMQLNGTELFHTFVP